MAPMSVMNLRHGYHLTKRLDPRDRGKEEVESGGPEREKGEEGRARRRVLPCVMGRRSVRLCVLFCRVVLLERRFDRRPQVAAPRSSFIFFLLRNEDHESP